MADKKYIDIGEDELKKLYSVKLVAKSSNMHSIGKIMFYGLLVLLACLFLPWQQNIKMNGYVTALNPGERPQTIQTIIAGRIEKWKIQEGDLVEKGDTIAIISEIKEKYFDPEILDRLSKQIQSKSDAIKSKSEKAKSIEGQIIALRNMLLFDVQKNKNKVTQSFVKTQSDSAEFSAAKIDFKIAKEQFGRQENLYKQGLKSLTELESRQLSFQKSMANMLSKENKLIESQNELINSQIELSATQSKYLEKITKSESELNATLSELYESEAELAKLEIEFSNVQIRSDYYIIKAPQSGYLAKVKKSGIGETVKEGEELLTIVPFNASKAIEFYAKPMDLPLLKVGTPLRIEFDGWPALVFSGWPGASLGTFAGEIAAIDKVASNPGKFRVLVIPQKGETWPDQIQMGTGAYGWNMLNTVFVWYEIWRQLNGFPIDLVYNDFPQNEEKAMKKEEKKENE